MSDNSLIEWCTATWNFLIGCTKKSAGCMHCYAIRQAWRLMHNPNSKIAKKFEGTVQRDSKGELNWTGRINFDDEVITKPLSWKLPRRVFVNSLSDLFHKNVKDEWIDQAFAVMALCPQHTFQILTKEPERMLAYMTAGHFTDRVYEAARYFGSIDQLVALTRLLHGPDPLRALPNVWLGTSCEDQKTADERVPLLLQTPAAVRWISAEPLLGPVDFGAAVGRKHGAEYHDKNGPCTCERDKRLDWVVVGGESGPGARSLDLNWIKSIVGQCRAADVPVFVKQLGVRPWWDGSGTKPPGSHIYLEEVVRDGKVGWQFDCMKDRKGGDMSEWPVDLRIREYPRAKAAAA